MAAHSQEAVGVVLVVVGGGFLIAAAVHSWLFKSGFRVSPVFKTVTAQERASAEHHGGLAIMRFVKVAGWLGGLLICCGAVVLAV